MQEQAHLPGVEVGDLRSRDELRKIYDARLGSELTMGLRSIGAWARSEFHAAPIVQMFTGGVTYARRAWLLDGGLARG